MSACLSESDFQRVQGSTGNPPELEQLQNHLRCCPVCQKQYKAFLEDEDLLRLMRQAARLQAQDPPSSVLSARLDQAPRRIQPQQIDGYKILGEIQRGGQGVVYKATQLSTQRMVALKILAEGWSTHHSSRRRFENEIELACQLRHPHIVSIYDSGLVGGHFYYAMEYVNGVRLDEYLRTKQPSLRQKVQLFKKICAAVSYAHQHGVIHRDLKPSNIAIDTAGEPRLLDFGLAKRIAGEADTLVKTATATTDFMGTLAYASPEQLTGVVGNVGLRSDVYALGVVFYEMLTATRPYPDGGHPAEMVKHISEFQPRRPSLFNQQIDRDLEAILFTALAKDPQQRYGSADHLEEDLERYLKGAPVHARRPTARYLAGKLLRRHRGKVASLAAGCVLFAALTIWSMVRIAAERDTAFAAQTREAQARQVEEDIRRALEDLLASANQEFADGHEPTVRELLDRAAQLIEPRLAGQPTLVKQQVSATLDRLAAQFNGRASAHIEASMRLPSVGKPAAVGIHVPAMAASAAAGRSAPAWLEFLQQYAEPAAANGDPPPRASVNVPKVTLPDTANEPEPIEPNLGRRPRLQGILRYSHSLSEMSEYVFAVDDTLHVVSELDCLKADQTILAYGLLRKAVEPVGVSNFPRPDALDAFYRGAASEEELAVLRGWLLSRYAEADRNRDGALDEQEAGRLYQEHVAKRRRWFLEQNPDSDLNFNGTLDDFELKAQARRARHLRMQQVLRDTPELDLDGNGRLNLEEYRLFLRDRASKREARYSGRVADGVGQGADRGQFGPSDDFTRIVRDFKEGRLTLRGIADEWDLIKRSAYSQNRGYFDGVRMSRSGTTGACTFLQRSGSFPLSVGLPNIGARDLARETAASPGSSK